MKWWTGTWFPGLGLWKAKKAKGLLEAVSLVEFLMNRRENKSNKHNSLLQQAIIISDDLGQIWGSGADPPIIQQPIRQLKGGKEADLTGSTEILCQGMGSDQRY